VSRSLGKSETGHFLGVAARSVLGLITGLASHPMGALRVLLSEPSFSSIRSRLLPGLLQRCYLTITTVRVLVGSALGCA
jgi:hypothetical protein